MPKKLLSNRLAQPLLKAIKTLADASGDLRTELRHQHYRSKTLVILNTHWLRRPGDCRALLGLEGPLSLTPWFDIILIMLPVVVRCFLLPRGGGAGMALALALFSAASFLPVAVAVIGRKAVFAERANLATRSLDWHSAKPFLKSILSVMLVSGRRTPRLK
jgi:hypothetical protein